MLETPEQSTDPFERLKNAASMLRISDATLRTWCKSGRVRWHRLGAKLIMIPRTEINRLLRESAIPTKAA